MDLVTVFLMKIFVNLIDLVSKYVMVFGESNHYFLLGFTCNDVGEYLLFAITRMNIGILVCMLKYM